MAAKCCRDSVNVAIKALEEAGILSWVNRLTRIRRRERDLFGQLVTVWRVIRTSNAYRFIDPLDRQLGRRGSKSENPARPQKRDLTLEGARLTGARVTQQTLPLAAPEASGKSAIAPQREHGSPVRAPLSPAERAALIAKLDTNPTKADWDAWDREVAALLQPT